MKINLMFLFIKIVNLKSSQTCGKIKISFLSREYLFLSFDYDYLLKNAAYVTSKFRLALNIFLNRHKIKYINCLVTFEILKKHAFCQKNSIYKYQNCFKYVCLVNHKVLNRNL